MCLRVSFEGLNGVSPSFVSGCIDSAVKPVYWCLMRGQWSLKNVLKAGAFIEGLNNPGPIERQQPPVSCFM